MEKMIKKILFLVLFLPCLVGAYHEFKVPKKAYRKVTIEYYSNEKEKTSPDSTVYIYYDKYDVEIYRVVKKGCGNVWDIADSIINADDTIGYQGKAAELDSIKSYILKNEKIY